jgi:YidC/Oxa1 family membrane protein insertase
MNDMRRTLLWVVFSMSLFLIWDAWNKHNGQPSLFSPPPAA